MINIEFHSLGSAPSIDDVSENYVSQENMQAKLPGWASVRSSRRETNTCYTRSDKAKKKIHKYRRMLNGPLVCLLSLFLLPCLIYSIIINTHKSIIQLK